jgi:hypothetical protein
MKKKAVWVKGLLVSIIVLAVMAGAGFSLLTMDREPLTAGKVEAGEYVKQAEVKVSNNIDNNGENAEATSGLQAVNEDKNEIVSQPVVTDAAVEKSAQQEDPAVNSSTTPVVVQTSLKAPVDFRAQGSSNSQQSNQPTEIPAASPAPEVKVEEAGRGADEQVQQTVPVTYSWGKTGNYTFRMEVKVVNNGSDYSRNVVVSVPFLENSSPYQTTTLKSTNYSIISSSGRTNTFDLGDLAPGESKTIVADFNISVRSLSINSTNETVEKARSIYQQYAGSGNCRDLARAFIKKANDQGIKAREVVGFARPQRGAMTSGSLQGSRHSWAEFYVEGLGWVPVDLTFQYFGAFPHTSHIVESYSDQSIKVNYSGGSLGATWSNTIL